MAQHRSVWLIAVVVLVVLAFVLPFTVFSGVDTWYGSFLFWVVVTALVVGINAIVSSSWKD